MWQLLERGVRNPNYHLRSSERNYDRIWVMVNHTTEPDRTTYFKTIKYKKRISIKIEIKNKLVQTNVTKQQTVNTWML